MKTLVTLLICRNYILSNWMWINYAQTAMLATPFKRNFINNWCQHKNICQTLNHNQFRRNVFSPDLLLQKDFIFSLGPESFQNNTNSCFNLIYCCVVLKTSTDTISLAIWLRCYRFCTQGFYPWASVLHTKKSESERVTLPWRSIWMAVRREPKW